MNVNRYYRKWRYYRSILGLLLCLGGLMVVFIWNEVILLQMPEKILIYQGQKQSIHFPIPVSATIVPETQNGEMTERYDEMECVEAIATPVLQTISMTADRGMRYRMNLSAFGIVPVQSVSVEVVSPKSVKLSGEAIGIYIKTKGALVIDTGSFDTAPNQSVSPAKDILQSGDYILRINGQQVNSKKDVTRLIQDCRGKELVFTIDRNGEVSQVAITPVQDEQGIYKIGIWVRDSAQGIGTVTYLTSEGSFAALGHGIGDADTQTIMQLGRGSIYHTRILGITKGQQGTPGQLTGIISFEKEDYLGRIEGNTTVGIYGTVTDEEKADRELATYEIVCPVALKQEVKRGKALIYCDVEGKPDFYEVRIDRYSYHGGEDNRQIMLTVTDERLLNLTGGIVQGMSGSPILQNGKIVGAVTHVLVNDPTRGYGIFIEEMLEAGDGGA